MWSARHIALNRWAYPADASIRMSTPINTQSNASSTSASPVTTNAQVAHELANLLDGSMRNVNLVRLFLTEQAAEALPADQDVTDRLQSAEQGMRQMATLLGQWLQQTQPMTEPSANSNHGPAWGQ